VLLAPDERTLLPTIASRCLRLRFPPPAPVTAPGAAPPGPGELMTAIGALAAARRTPGTADAKRAQHAAAALDLAEALGRDRPGADAALAALEAELAAAARASAAGEGALLTWREASERLDALTAFRRAFVQNANAQLGLEQLLLRAQTGGSSRGSS
jgi:hypothetical protein